MKKENIDQDVEIAFMVLKDKLSIAAAGRKFRLSPWSGRLALHRACIASDRKLYISGTNDIDKTPSLHFLRKHATQFLTGNKNQNEEIDQYELRIPTQRKIRVMLKNGDKVLALKYANILWKARQKNLLILFEEDVTLFEWLFNKKEEIAKACSERWRTYNEYDPWLHDTLKKLYERYVLSIQYALVLSMEGII